MKKIMIIILVIALALVGCQSENNNNNVNDSLNSENIVSVTPEESIEYGDFKGYLWEIKNEDATVYLFGSIHIAKEEMYPFAEVVEVAFESSDVLAVEADVTDIVAALEFAGDMAYTDGEVIYDHLTEAGIKKYNEACETLGIKPQLFERFKVWAAGSNLMSMQLMQGGYMSTDGIDMHFTNRAKTLDLEIFELEGIKFQIDLMNNFTDLQQETMFISELGTLTETVEEFEILYEKFMSGDVADMTEYLLATDNELTSDDDVEQAMLQDRNIGMAEKIDGFLQTDQTYFVIVGLAHYLGDESVIKYLEEMGYTIERK